MSNLTLSWPAILRGDCADRAVDVRLLHRRHLMLPGALADTSRLRLYRLWQAIGLVLVAFVIDMSLTTDPITLPGNEGDKFGHIIAYGTLMFWFAQLYARRVTRAGWALTFVAMGIALEFVQGMTDYRSFEVADMFADGAGVLIGWLCAPPRTPHLIRFVEARLFRLLA
jgi:VanZ family protein